MHDAFVCVWNMYIFVNIFLRAKCQKKIHLSKLLAVTSCWEAKKIFKYSTATSLICIHRRMYNDETLVAFQVNCEFWTISFALKKRVQVFQRPGLGNFLLGRKVLCMTWLETVSFYQPKVYVVVKYFQNKVFA